MTETASSTPEGRRTATSIVFALAGLVVVEFMVFVLGLGFGVRGWDIAILFLALATVFVGAIPIATDWSRPAERRQILISLTTLAYVVYLVVPVFTQYFPIDPHEARGTFHLARNDPRDIVHAQTITLAGLVMFLIGFYMPIGRATAAVIPRPTNDWPANAALAMSVIVLVVGWLVFIPGQLGIIPSRLGSGALGTLASGSYFGIALLALTWLRYRRSEALILLAIVIPIAMFVNFFTGSKRMFLTPPFMVFLAYMVAERRIRMSWVAAGIALLVVIYPVSEFYRQEVQTDKARSIRHFVQNPGQALSALSQFGSNVDWSEYFTSGVQSTGGRLDSLGILTVIVKDTPGRVPYQGGWSIGYIALSWIPRVIWAGKPGITIGEWVSQTYGSQFDLYTDVGPTWMGEFFFNWGHTGVILGMFALGFFCRILQERLFLPGGTIPALFAAVIVLYCVTRNVQSSLLAPVNRTLFDIAPILAAHVLVGLVTGYQRASPKSDSESPAQGQGLSHATAGSPQ